VAAPERAHARRHDPRVREPRGRGPAGLGRARRAAHALDTRRRCGHRRLRVADRRLPGAAGARPGDPVPGRAARSRARGRRRGLDPLLPSTA
jgi:hypothetical protein